MVNPAVDVEMENGVERNSDDSALGSSVSNEAQEGSVKVSCPRDEVTDGGNQDDKPNQLGDKLVRDREPSENDATSPPEEEIPSPPKTENNSDAESDNDGSAGEEVEVSSLEGTPAKKRKMHESQYAGVQALRHHQLLKKTKESFVQNKPCDKLKDKLRKCMECRASGNSKPGGRRGKDNICRFYQFRKLKYNACNSKIVAGFLDISDHSEIDLKIWMPNEPPAGMSFELAKYLLEEVGDQFCHLVKQERDTLKYLEDQVDKTIIWRRTVKDLRELCDVCSTTLFNYHWTCGNCGFVVCVSCFSTRKASSIPVPDENSAPSTSKDETEDSVPEPEVNKHGFEWLKCHKKNHELKNLRLTQIIVRDSLEKLSEMMHTLRQKLGIPYGCDCKIEGNLLPEGDNSSTNIDGKKESIQSEPPNSLPIISNSADGDDKDKDVKMAENDLEDEQEGIMDLFGEGDDDSDDGNEEESQETKALASESAVEQPNTDKMNSSSACPISHQTEKQLTYFVRRGGPSSYSIKVLPKRVLSLSESSVLYPGIRHSWLCKGSLLRLLEATNPRNFKFFQDQWKRGQPVLVSDVASKLKQNLWTPESFSNDFGHKSCDLINCMTGKVVRAQKIKKFWDGFEYMKRRLQDEQGVPMLLKLKDWPPKADFAEISPERFQDLMGVLPLGEYTFRNGMLNLAARLPEIFSKPDLGPKMYIAYGSGLFLDKGTTNLHLDISDAVNVMVHVATVKDMDITEHTRAVMEAIRESDCDQATQRRIELKEDLPGALWHIWGAEDADKIRDMINKVLFEQGKKVERHHDPIHDQSIYLDREMRQRLMRDYNVGGYAIVQCAGDAIFIPAGAPHQVRNLNNCIKIAEDFVSPENVGHCFYLTEEFRNLSDTHSNHEDKLQIKNIVYHTIKDAVAVVNASLEGNKLK